MKKPENEGRPREKEMIYKKTGRGKIDMQSVSCKRNLQRDEDREGEKTRKKRRE